MALDTGVTWVFDKQYKPSITVGLAHGSGDSARGDNNDKSFRQSGLHSNKFKFNGLTRFKYLGEVLDPELTNIDILTVGAGGRLNKDWSLDIVYHHYRQATVDNRLRGADFEIDPDGQSDSLGDAVDFVFGYRHSKALDLTAVAGVFDPGSAFAPSTDNAWLVNVEVEYKF